MSAIAALWHLDGRPIDPASSAAIETSVGHFGSRPCGSWRSGSVALHCGVLRITPEDAFEKQPLLSADGGLVLVGDARLDDRDGLADALGLPSVGRSSWPDSALLLRSYERWGRGCFAHLLGAFALVLWDTRERTLTLATDPMGERCLFLARSDRRVAVASSPKALLALPGMERRLNEEMLVATALRLPPPRSTFYAGIDLLEAGHAMEIRADRTTARRYWSLEPGATRRLPRPEDYVEAARELLQNAVSARLRSAKPVGAFMSGGLDSTAVAVTASRARSRLPVYTAVPRPGFRAPAGSRLLVDESPFVEAIRAQHPKLDVHYVDTSANSFDRVLERSLDVTDQPIVGVFNQIWWTAILDRAREAGLGVLLEGQYGNVTLSWRGEPSLGRLVAATPASQWLGLIAGRVRRRGIDGTLRNGILPWLLPPWLRREREIIDRAIGRRPSPLIGPRRIDPHEVRRFASRAARFRDGSRQRRLRLMPISGQASRQAWRADTGIEIRDPFADRRIVEFCWSVPLQEYERDGLDRSLARRMLAGELPDEVVFNRRRIVQSADWVERFDSLQDYFRREIDRLASVEAVGRFVDVAAMRHLLSKWPGPEIAPDGGEEFRTSFTRALSFARFIAMIETPG